ncbi:hypothetical protein HDF08_004026 [Edaphobacter lichenicola]|uniref:Uncharacterized protein n=1 Tax=Tunturiibacter lichenicola TaxID=2051959 RepID=A0A852VJI9_9BACT|nr:hypothetical protein [Edaphobacter lichenicola]
MSCNLTTTDKYIPEFDEYEARSKLSDLTTKSCHPERSEGSPYFVLAVVRSYAPVQTQTNIVISTEAADSHTVCREADCDRISQSQRTDTLCGIRQDPRISSFASHLGQISPENLAHL